METKLQLKAKEYATATMTVLTISIILASIPHANAAGTITLTPIAQAPAASVTVNGSGFGATKTLGIGFGTFTKVVDEIMNVTGPFDVGAGPYVGYLPHPIDPGSFTMSELMPKLSTDPVKMFDDAGNGALIKATAFSIALIDNATIDYATGKFTVFTFEPVSSTGGFVRYVSYSRCQYDVTPITNITTNGAGSFSANIIVPAVTNGNYTVTAIDSQGNSAAATLNVNNTIPEDLPFGVMVLLSTAAMSVGIRYFRKRPKFENSSHMKP